MIRFQVSTRWSGRIRTLQVRVYDTQKEMVAAAERYNRTIGSERDGWEGVHGTVQTLEAWNIDKDGEEVLLPDVGYMRLYRDALGIGLIAHECTHVACAIFYGDVSKAMPHRNTTKAAAKEEQLAYMVGDLTTKIVGKLYDKGLY